MQEPQDRVRSIEETNTSKAGPILIVGSLTIFVSLSLPLLVTIFLWKVNNARPGFGEYILPLSLLGIWLIVLFFLMFCLRFYLRKVHKPSEFRWSILFLVLGLLFLVASFQFLVAMPTDGDEGWTYLFGSLTYPFFVGFSSIWFLFHKAVSMTKEKVASRKARPRGDSTSDC